MQLLYNIFYRQFGIRRLQQVLSPRLFNEDSFSFPKNAIYHHVSHNENDLAPDQEHPYFHAYRKRIFMDVVTDLSEIKGNARKVGTAPQNFYRPFFLKNKLFKFTRDAIKVNKDPQTLTAVDYGYLQKLYRYTKVPLTPYYQWWNIEKTVWENIRTACQESERQNFLFLNVPDILPSLSMLRLYTNKVNNVFLHVFDSHEKRFVLELWKWIDPNVREETFLGKFTQEELEKVNLILVHKEKWCVLNLGVFNKWRKDPKHEEAETEEQVDKSKTPTVSVGYQPAQLQKLMLRMFISIHSQSLIEVEPEKEEDLSDTSTSSKETDAELDEESPETEPKINTEIQTDKATEIDPSEKLHELGPDIDETESSQLDIDTKVFDEIDKDLEALEYIEQKNLMLKGVSQKFHKDDVQEPDVPEAKKEITFEATEEDRKAIRDQIFTEHSAQGALKEYIDRHAEYGLMSAADYRKVVKQSETFMASKAPYKEDTPIHEFIKIQDHELKIAKEEIKLPEVHTVPDKTMLESSLISFDKKYIKNVMPKDITAMIVNIQKAGIIVQDYQIEQEAGALGAYEIHTIRVKPVDGVASTLRFKLPKVDDEGNFIANGNKYHMRKQRGDYNFLL